MSLTGVDQAQVLEEAKTAAGKYVKQQVYRRGFLAKVPPLGYLAAGAILSAAVMALGGWFV